MKENKGKNENGMAMAMVLVALSILFLITIPFSVVMKVEKRARANSLSNTKARLACDGILDYSVSRLARTCDHHERYTAQDTLWKTPDYDSPKEYEVALAIPGQNLSNPKGDIWSVYIEDEAGKIHINSASPYLLGNLIGSAIIKEVAQPYDTEIVVDSTFPFEDAGYLWIEGELISYEKKETDRFVKCKRGLYSESPRFIEAQTLKPGMLAIDARAHRICSHRISKISHSFIPYRTVEEIRQISDLSAYSIDANLFARIEPFLTVYPLYNAFLHSQTLQNNVPDSSSEENKGSILKIQDTSVYRPGMTVRVKQGSQEVYAMVVKSSSGQIQLDTQIKESFMQNKASVSVLDSQPIHINTAHPKVLYSLFKGIQAYTGYLDAETAGILASSVFGYCQEGNCFKSHSDLYQFLQTLQEGLKKQQTTDSAKDALNYQRIFAILSQAICVSGYKTRFQGIMRYERNANVPDKERYLPSYPLASLVYRNQDTYTLHATAILNDIQGMPLARHSVKRMLTIAPLSPQAWRLESQKDFEEQRQRFSSYKIITKPNLLQPFSAFPESNPEAQGTGLSLDSASVYPPRSPQGSALLEYYPWNNTFDGILCPKDPPPTLRFVLKDKEIVPGSLVFWFYPLSKNKFYSLFDMGQKEWEDRIFLSYENNTLRLSLYDACMDKKALEISAELPLEERWYHIIAGWDSTNPGGVSLWIDGEPKGESHYLLDKSQFKASLLDNITKDSKRIALSDTSGLESQGVIKIGEEAIEYSQILGNNLIVRERYENYNAQDLQRGARSTTAAAHPKGVMVYPFGYSESLITKVFPASELLHDIHEAGELYSKLDKDLKAIDKEIFSSTEDFPQKGFLLIAHQGEDKRILHEIIRYNSIQDQVFSDCDRGQFSTKAQKFPFKNTYIFPISLLLKDHKEYEKEGIIQLDNEWISYEKKWDDLSSLIFLTNFPDDILRTWISAVSKGKKYQPDYRGVCGTQSAKHRSGEKAIPVFQIKFAKAGKYDQATLISGNKPQQKELHEVNWAYGRYVAFKKDVKEKYLPQSQTRLLKFPSGELPSVVSPCLWGKSITKDISGSFLLDELHFIQAKSRTKCFLSDPALKENDEIVMNSISDWPQDGGIAKIEDEYIAFSEIENNRLFPPHRGFLKSQQGIYEAGTPVYYFFSLPSSMLEKSTTPYGSRLSVKNTNDFYQEGYLRIGDEILSYTEKTSNSFSMPENAEEKGLLRGCFGTTPTAHVAHEIAYSFPVRYWDRYLKGYDGPKGAYFEAAKHAPGAFWKKVFWKEENPAPNYLEIVVKVRANGKPDWETKPANKEGGIFEFTDSKAENTLNIEADYLEVRVYFSYKTNAYQKGYWTYKPILKSLFIEHHQPVRVWENFQKNE